MSTPQLGLFILENKKTDEYKRKQITSEIEVFLKKFSIPFEVFYLKHSEKNVKNFLVLCKQSQAPLLVSLNIQMTTPLGDIFKLVQNLTSENNALIAFGNRFHKTPNITRDLLFTNILQDKKAAVLKDPFCEYFVCKKELIDNLSSIQHSKSFFITADIQKVILKNNINYLEIPIIETAPGLKNSFIESLYKILFVAKA